MTEWIKPSEIPEDYWGPAWVCSRWSSDNIHQPDAKTIRKNKYWSDNLEMWEYMSDTNYRVMLINKPERITIEEWRV